MKRTLLLLQIRVFLRFLTNQNVGHSLNGYQTFDTFLI